jgi:hypothetical protein
MATLVGIYQEIYLKAIAEKDFVKAANLNTWCIEETGFALSY